MAVAKKKQQHVSPRGTFKYPHLQEPDYGTDEYPKENGEYNVKLILSPEDAEAFRKKMQRYLDESEKKAMELDKKRKPAARKQKPMTLREIGNPVYDDNDEETGEIEINFKTAASGVSKKTGKKWTKKLAVFDAAKKPIPEGVAVWGGSEGKVAFTVNPYFVGATGEAGVSFYLEAVQVLELSNGSAKSADSFGFDEEDGFEAEEDGSEAFDDDNDAPEDEDEEDF